jgi:hypothetical protein
VGRESIVLAELIYNSVITLFVGEKIMIDTLPSISRPARVSAGSFLITNHSEPDPMAFRFAEPVMIDLNRTSGGDAVPIGVPGNLAKVVGRYESG